MTKRFFSWLKSIFIFLLSEAEPTPDKIICTQCHTPYPEFYITSQGICEHCNYLNRARNYIFTITSDEEIQSESMNRISSIFPKPTDEDVQASRQSLPDFQHTPPPPPKPVNKYRNKLQYAPPPDQPPHPG